MAVAGKPAHLRRLLYFVHAGGTLSFTSCTESVLRSNGRTRKSAGLPATAIQSHAREGVENIRWFFFLRRHSFFLPATKRKNVAKQILNKII